jgi:Spy/CpxP family protein refolding chaperone
MNHLRRLVLAALLLLTALPAHGEGFGEPRKGPPAFLKELFLPALVMEHQRDIELTPEQRNAITRQMTATQQKILELRWGLEEKSEALDKLLSAERVDEKAALARAAEVMDVERQMKQAHLELLIRIKNQLTATQQEKLRAMGPGERGFGFRRHFHGGGPPPGEPPPEE